VDELDATFLLETNALLQEYITAMESVKIRHALHLVMQISARGNLFLQQTKFFDLFKSNPAACARVTSRAINLIYALTALVHPFMPAISTEILKQLNAPARTVPDVLSNDILPGHVLGTPDYLFKKIEEKSADVWRPKFGGGATAITEDAVPVAAPLSKSGASKLKKKEAAAAKLAAGPVPSGTAAVPLSELALALQLKLSEQGDKVRRLKAGEALESGESLSDAIAELLKLKLSFAEAS